MDGKKNRAGKWNFLGMLIVCGVFYMAFVDPERIYAAPFNELYVWVKEKAASGASSDVGVSAGDDDFMQEPEQGTPQDGESVEDDSSEKSPSEAEPAIEDPSVEPEAPPEEAGVPDYRDPEEIIYAQVEDDYFADALFIGDSRTVGMFEYGGLEEIATFYAETGLTIYRLLDTTVSVVDEDGVPKKLTIEEALTEERFGKIYLMVGINELGTGTPETFLEKYAEVVGRIQELQPSAILYIQGIMKVTAERSDQSDYINNEAIEIRNEGLTGLVNNVTSYYLDVNPAVCDDTGGLESSYTFDGVHLKAQYIQLWKDFLKEHAVANTFQEMSVSYAPE